MNIIVVISILLFVCLVSCSHKWTELESSTEFGNERCFPLPKEGGNCVNFHGNLACKNGYVPCFSQAACGQADVYQDELFLYDTSDGEWTCISPPSPTGDRVFGAMWSRDGNNDVFFGFGGSIICPGIPTSVHSDLWKVNVATNTWTDLTSTMTGTPGPRLGPGYDSIADGIFLFTGGVNQFFQAQNDVYSYNAFTNTWTQIQASLNNDTIRPHGRFNAKFVCSEDFPLCILSFGDTLEGVPLNDVWSFNTLTHVWTHIAPTAPASATQPGDRVQFCAFLKKSGHHLFLYVGFGDADDAPRCTNAVSGYGDNPTNTQWRIRVDVPGGSWEDVTSEIIGDARSTKSPACTQVANTAFMVWGHAFTCPYDNTTGLPLLNRAAYSLRLPNP